MSWIIHLKRSLSFIYFFESNDLLLQALGARFGSHRSVSDGITDNGWRVLCAIETLLTIDVVNVVIELLGVVVDNDDDEDVDADADEIDGIGLTIVFMKRTGTSLVK